MSFQMLRPSEHFAAILDFARVRPPGDTWSEQGLLSGRHLPASGLLSEVGHGYGGGASSLWRCGWWCAGVVHVSGQNGMDGLGLDSA